jgi:mRNA-degrading endonuclease YafQ of YafQ-DinJ toxin-antitoxin module
LIEILKKNFKLRVLPNKNLSIKYKSRSDAFIKDRRDPILKDHKLFGKMSNFRSFSITGDIRIIYKEVKKNNYVFLDIGSYNQVYK